MVTTHHGLGLTGKEREHVPPPFFEFLPRPGTGGLAGRADAKIN